MTLYAVLEEAAKGTLPTQDGQVEVCGEDTGKAAGAVVAFPAHFYVVAPVEPEWVRGMLPPGDYTAPLGARFLTALADRLGAGIGSVDAVLAARAHGGGSPLTMRPASDRTHQRVRRAERYRDDVRVWETGDGMGCLVLGRGLAGRWEVAFEVEPEARGHGLGRALAAAALGLLATGTPVFAQVAPGNSVSLRAVLAAGYAPVGGEVLLPRQA
jgi:GNAT superfamily N-acetyltransferase